MKKFFFALILGLMSSVPTWARETTFDFTWSNLQWAPVAGDSKSFKTSQNGFTAIVKLNETSKLEYGKGYLNLPPGARITIVDDAGNVLNMVKMEDKNNNGFVYSGKYGPEYEVINGNGNPLIHTGGSSGSVVRLNSDHFYFVSNWGYQVATVMVREKKISSEDLAYAENYVRSFSFELTDNLVGVQSAALNGKSLLIARSEKEISDARKQMPTEEQIANRLVVDNPALFKQYNWIAILLPQEYKASDYVGKLIPGGTIIGKYCSSMSDANGGYMYLNPVIETDRMPNAADLQGGYTTMLNTYMPANFGSHETHFLIHPRPNEVLKMKYVVFHDNKIITLPAKRVKPDGSVVNSRGLRGGTFYHSLNFLDDGTYDKQQLKELKTAEQYQPTMNYVTSKAIACIEDWAQENLTYENDATKEQEIFTYLFPWSPKKSWESFSARALVPMAIAQFTPSGDVVTSADNPHTTKAVASTRYYDLAGKLRTKPEKGVNIIVTTYTDGSTQVTKLLK